MDWYVIALKDRTYGVIVLSDSKPTENLDIELETDDPDESVILEAGTFDVCSGPLPECEAHRELDRTLASNRLHWIAKNGR